jgi:hypothetical protein
VVTTQNAPVPRPRAEWSPTEHHHEHPWPQSPSAWDELSDCARCGATLLRLFRYSAEWVVRRVENVSFVDDCTVRRFVSVDYEPPPDALAFRCPDGEVVRLLPLAILRRKSLINFDFRDHDGTALSLLGLRQNQALTLAVARAWAKSAQSDGQRLDPLSKEVDRLLDDVVAGDQAELRAAYRQMWAAEPGDPLERLGKDRVFRVTLDRFADSFVLFHLHRGSVHGRRVVKFSYDEPFTLRHYRSAYQPASHHDGVAEVTPKEEDEKTRLPRWSWPSVRAAMGFAPTVIEFPVPAAELAASFHFQISAPPEVSIADAALLAGRPNMHRSECLENGARTTMRGRVRNRPSFDHIGGGYPTVDLHVVDVPYGSRSHAHVSVEPRIGGWFASAVLSSWLAAAVLLLAWMAEPEFSAGSALLMSFAAALVAILVRPDPHRLLSRLLSTVRLLAVTVAVLTFAAAAVVAFTARATAHRWLGILFVASLLATIVVSSSWLSAVARHFRSDPQESPWEHRRPRRSKGNRETPHEELARRIQNEDFPYDYAFERLGFGRPAVRVASCEGARNRLIWSRRFSRDFDGRLARLSETVTRDAG